MSRIGFIKFDTVPTYIIPVSYCTINQFQPYINKIDSGFISSSLCCILIVERELNHMPDQFLVNFNIRLIGLNH